MIVTAFVAGAVTAVVALAAVARWCADATPQTANRAMARG